MPKKKLIELLIDEDADAFGVEAISLVKYPAIESNFIYFSKQGKREKTLYAMASVDEEKRTLIGPALIPDKHIPRYDEFSDEEYDVYFSKQTVQKASELFLKTHRTSAHTFEHESPVEDVHVVESWIVSNPDLDKARHFGLDVPEGTWMVRVQVENDEMWQFVKEQKVAGFSIEGYFLDKLETMAARPQPSLGRRLKSIVTGRKLYAEINTDSGAVFATESDEFTPGVEVYKIGPDGTAVEVSNGTYKTKAGTPFEVYDGVVTEWDGEVAAVENKDEPAEKSIDQLKEEYKSLYEKKLQSLTLSHQTFGMLSGGQILKELDRESRRAYLDGEREIGDNLVQILDFVAAGDRDGLTSHMEFMNDMDANYADDLLFYLHPDVAEQLFSGNW